MAHQRNQRGWGQQQRYQPGRTKVIQHRYPIAESIYGKRIIKKEQYRFLAPVMLVKKIIGSGGENIKAALNKLHAVDPKGLIVLAKKDDADQDLPKEAKDRILTIQSTREGLEVGLDVMIPACQFHDNLKMLEIKAMVPSHCMSQIMGRGGEIVKEIEAETGCTIRNSKLPLPNSDEVCVKVLHENLEGMKRAIMKITDLVNERKSQQAICRYNPMFFEDGEYGNTGSWQDANWYRTEIKAGRLTINDWQPRGGCRKPMQQQQERFYASGGYGATGPMNRPGFQPIRGGPGIGSHVGYQEW